MRRKLIVTDGYGEREVLLVGTVTVGRDPGCEISASDPALSRHHAEFLETASGVFVRDLHSQNGIKVNNVAVREAMLRPGDIVSIAALNLKYSEDAAPDAAPAHPPNTADERTVLLGGQPGQPAPAPPAVPAPPQPAAVAPPSSAASSTEQTGVMSAPPPPGRAIPRADHVAPPMQGSPASPAPPAPAPPAAQRTPQSPGAPQQAGANRSVAKDERTGERTNVMPMPPQAPAGPPPAARAGSANRASVQEERTGERTNVMPVPAAAGAAPAAAAAAAAAVAAKPSAARAAPAAKDAAPVKVKAATSSSWAARVLVRVLLLTLVVSLLSAVPLMYWHQQQMNAVALSRATALANLLAADASLALSTGQDLDAATQNVLAESGVVAARILNLDGHVLAPASRSAETVTAFPGVNAAPSDVLRPRAEWNGDVLEVVSPVSAKGSPRAALAWITISPTTEFNGSSLVVTAPIVLVSLLLGWIVASLLTRSTMRGFSRLNEDVELALSGRTDAVRDPLGAKPLTDLTNTINYLVARLRGSDGDEPSLPLYPSPMASPVAQVRPQPQPKAVQPPPKQARPAAAPVAAAVPPPAPAAITVEARLTVDPGFHVTDASPGCADLLGVRPDALIGRHLLDAIADRQIADAVLGCLSALPAQGERQAVVADAAGRRLVATVSRAGKDKPVTITLRTAEPHSA